MLACFLNLANRKCTANKSSDTCRSNSNNRTYISCFCRIQGRKRSCNCFRGSSCITAPSYIICIGVFLIVLLITGIVSVSSMSAGISFPIFLFIFFDTPSLIFKIFSILVAIALMITHRKNIGRC